MTKVIHVAHINVKYVWSYFFQYMNIQQHIGNAHLTVLP